MIHVRIRLPNSLRPRLHITTPYALPVSAIRTQWLDRPILDLITLLFGKEMRSWSSALCSFLNPHFTSPLLRPNILLDRPFRKPKGSLYFPLVAGHVSRPRKTRHKIIILNILILTFVHVDSKRGKQKINGSFEFNLLSTSSWMQFWFVSVVPEFLNVPSFWKFDWVSLRYRFVLETWNVFNFLRIYFWNNVPTSDSHSSGTFFAVFIFWPNSTMQCSELNPILVQNGLERQRVN